MQKPVRLLLSCALLLIIQISNVFAANPTPLPADQAFILSANVIDAKHASVQWQIAPGYYLYAKRLHINIEPANAGEVVYPQGEFKYSPELGRYEVFFGTLQVPINLTASLTSINIKVSYQGCSEDGFCYPPTNKELTLPLTGAAQAIISPVAPAQAVTVKEAPTFSLLSDQNSVREVLDKQSLAVILLIFAGIGLLLAFTPCVLPMIPILTSIIIGQKRVTTHKAFFLSSSYVLGSAVTYSLAGIAAVFMGSSLQVWLQKPWVIGAVSLLFVLLALSLFNLYHLQLPRKLQHFFHQLSHKQQGGTFAGVFMMGMISTLIVSPCVTAPLVGVLIYISQTGDYLLGASALFFMGLGMGVPLMLLGISAGKWLPKRGPWMEAVKKTFGFLMLGMAIWMLARVVPAKITFILWTALCVSLTAFFITCLAHIARLHNKWHNKWIYSMSMLIAISGLIVVANAVPSIWMNQWQDKTISVAKESFTVVQSVEEINKQLLIARTLQKPAVLDFYADWCESCVQMDKSVFNLPQVRQALNNFVRLRVDLTANSKQDEELLRSFAVVAPPTVLFFTTDGQEVNSRRIVGEISAQEFLNKLNTFFTASCDKTVQC